MTQPPAAPFPRQIRHYDLVRLLGQGGMGLVVEGIDRRDGSKVAVKLLYGHLAAADPSFLERFEREAHVGALLRSPYTVHLLDFGNANGQSFLVMEFVDGQSLADLVARGPLDTATALRIASEVGRALEEAGARGVVHRDIKPENVLIDREGRVKVTDFGIARSSAASNLTMTGGFVGTPAYAAPEQVDGQVDHRSDIYALGVTLYTMLSGQPPFRGKTAMDTLFQHRTAPLPMAPLAHLPDVIQNIVRRALEKDPLDRYQSAAEFMSALDRARQNLSRSGLIPPAQPQQSRPAAAPPAQQPAASLPPSLSRQETGSMAHVSPQHAQPVPAAGSYVPPVSRAPASAAPSPSNVLSRAPAQPVPVEQLPASRQPERKKKSRMPLVLGVLAAALVAGGVIAGVVLLSGGGDDETPANPGGSPSPTSTETPSETSTAEPTASVSATISPTVEVTPERLPSVTPPVPASRLQSGDGAIVTSTGAAVNLWRNPSEGSPGNEILATLFTGEGVIIVTNSMPESTLLVTEGLVFWRALIPGTTTVGWIKEVVVTDESLRYLEPARTHQVDAGDTCASIASGAGVTLEDFLGVNRFDETACQRLTVGSLVIIPN